MASKQPPTPAGEQLPETMRALVLDTWGGPFRLDQRPVPLPGPGEALMRVRAAGVGLTLGHIRRGAFGGETPRIIGHELGGDIAAVGTGVENVSAGDRCLVYFYLNCGACRFCLGNRETLCVNSRGLVGVSRDGGFADYVCLPASNFLHIPDNVSYADAAVTADAVCTPWHAIKERARVQPLDDVLILGAGGGVGIHGVQMAKLFGGRVIAVDVSPAKLDLALKWGADDAFDAGASGLAEQIRMATGGKGVESCVDFVGNAQTVQLGIQSLAVAGRMVIVGVQPGAVPFDPSNLVRTEQTITGSRHVTKLELQETIAVVARGLVTPVISARRPLEKAEELFDLIDRQELLGRAVLEVG